MIIYEATKQDFMVDSEQELLVSKICFGFEQRIGHTHDSEVRAWQNSLNYMYKVLNDAEIPADSGVAIEFRLPGTSRRVDFILSGLDSEKKSSAVIIELKQWESATSVSGADGIVKTFMGGGLNQTVHPSYQAWSYASFFKDYNVEVEQRPIRIYPCAYLHNYEKRDPEALLAPQYQLYVDQAPPFMKGDISQLRAFIKKYVHYGDQRETLYHLENSEIRPSKSLQDLLGSMMKGNQAFVLIDSQKLVFETALISAYATKKQYQKKVLIVEGGPGTGKSVIAINLLVRLTQQNLLVQYVTKNSAPRHVYEAKLTGSMIKSRISNLFQTSGAYVDTPVNSIDALIIDEAHRLTDRSGMFRNKGEDQTKEMIQAARFTVFFIDESQRVTTTDKGSIDRIRKFAMQAGAEITTMRLDSQFRCNGSDGYIAWLDDVLDIHETANDTSFLGDYDFQVLNSPVELRERIYLLNRERNKARLLAGYCWEWDKDKRADPTHTDIEIPGFNFRMSWNLDNTSTWAIDPESVSQVGCIHTSQGLEFDYVGVIIGLDLRYEKGHIVTDYTRRAKTDQSLKGIKAKAKMDPQGADDLADEIIKNTYRTLMTRGMKGCYIYCCDPGLRDYLRFRLSLKPEGGEGLFVYPELGEDMALLVAEGDGNDYRI